MRAIDISEKSKTKDPVRLFPWYSPCESETISPSATCTLIVHRAGKQVRTTSATFDKPPVRYVDGLERQLAVLSEVRNRGAKLHEREGKVSRRNGLLVSRDCQFLLSRAYGRQVASVTKRRGRLDRQQTGTEKGGPLIRLLGPACLGIADLLAEVD